MITRLGTGRVWSLAMMTIFFLPFTSSASGAEPIGFANASSTRADSLLGAL
jgi:hypothetical protein